MISCGVPLQVKEMPSTAVASLYSATMKFQQCAHEVHVCGFLHMSHSLLPRSLSLQVLHVHLDVVSGVVMTVIANVHDLVGIATISISFATLESVLLLLCSGRVALELAHVQDDVVPGRTPNAGLGVQIPVLAGVQQMLSVAVGHS